MQPYPPIVGLLLTACLLLLAPVLAAGAENQVVQPENPSPTSRIDAASPRSGFWALFLETQSAPSGRFNGSRSAGRRRSIVYHVPGDRLPDSLGLTVSLSLDLSVGREDPGVPGEPEVRMLVNLGVPF